MIYRCTVCCVTDWTHLVHGRWACVSPVIEQKTWLQASREAAFLHRSGTKNEQRLPIAKRERERLNWVFF